MLFVFNQIVFQNISVLLRCEIT